MKCPFCSNPDSKVIDSRPADDGARIRRRRVCPTCGRRFTTYEAIETAPVLVVKRDGSRQPFDRNKLILGMLRACAKRHVDSAVIERAVDEIEMSLVNSFIKEVRRTLSVDSFSISSRISTTSPISDSLPFTAISTTSSRS